MAAAGRVRRTTLFSGQVQGVGFRFTARDVARDYSVAGYVRNLSDGRVELVAEGDPGELERFLAAVKQAMTGCIRDSRTIEDAATGEFSGFSIRH